MQFHVDTFLIFLATALWVLATWTIAGSSIVVIARRLGVNAPAAAPRAMIGLAAIILVSWYWAGPLGGVNPVARILVVIGAVTAGIDLVLRRRSSKTPFVWPWREPETRRRVVMFAICAAGLALIVLVTRPALFGSDQPTVLSRGNNDAAAYAIHGEHLRVKGADDPGNIVGENLGARDMGFANGSLSTLASAGSVTHQDVFSVQESTFYATLVLAAFSIALLLYELLGREHPATCALAAVVGFAGFYTTYPVGNWFFAQFIALACVAAVATLFVHAMNHVGRREYVGVILVGAVIFAGGLAAYPHMTLFGSACLLPLVALSTRSFRDVVRNSVRAVVLLAGVAVVSVAGASGIVTAAIRATEDLSSVKAGWPLAPISLAEVLGLQTIATAKETTAWTPVVTVALLAIFGGLIVVIWRRVESIRPMLLGLASIPVITIVSSRVFLAREGSADYRYWKWTTFFVPIAVAALVLIVLLAGSTATKHRSTWVNATSIAVGTLALFGLVLGTGAGVGLLEKPATYLSVTKDQTDLETNPNLVNIHQLNVNVSPFWETMWLAYFLRGKEITLAAKSYMRTHPAQSRWSIERNDMPAPAPGSRSIRLNDTYRLVEAPADPAPAVGPAHPVRVDPTDPGER
jgi:hypothetical protein